MDKLVLFWGMQVVLQSLLHAPEIIKERQQLFSMSFSPNGKKGYKT
jgi:hypothetical protein